VTYLLFVDDCFMFCKAKESEAKVLLDILHKYEGGVIRSSHQHINQRFILAKILALE